MSYGEVYPYHPEKIHTSVGHERRESESDGAFRPSFLLKFNPRLVKQKIQIILKERLEKAIYDKDQAPGWAHEIAEAVKAKLLGLDLNRYKYIVNVTILENKGVGARMQINGLWDLNTDSYAQEIFKNETIICVVMAFGVYFY
ncbi:Tctex1 domain-containing protein 2 [Gigaspora margarita]|uniref:Tctex1 domain-containing protein 2 n=2 Tax=Gigaspora margarita TaxID=4874 RepID=A0A8H4APE4_GIGMA|nr:Tctex1 domain-containing protein 2 [Gigaspora margarita]